jgi:hypothetical protein
MRYKKDEGKDKMKLHRPEYIEMKRQPRNAFMIGAHEASTAKRGNRSSIT